MPNTKKIQAKQGMIHIHMTIKNLRESMYMRLLLFSPGSEILEVPHDLFGRLHEWSLSLLETAIRARKPRQLPT